MCRPNIDTNNPQGIQLGRFKNRARSLRVHLLHLISIMSFKLGNVSIPKRRIFLPLFLFCAYDSSVLQNFKIFTHLLPYFSHMDPRMTEVTYHCNNVNDSVRKDFVYSVQTLRFSCSHTLSILFRSFYFLAPRFCLSCLGPLGFLLPDFVYSVQTFWFSCSHTLAILFRSFYFLSPRLCLSCLDPLVFLLPDFVYPVSVLWFSCSQTLSILFRSFGFLASRFCLSCLGPMVFLLE